MRCSGGPTPACAVDGDQLEREEVGRLESMRHVLHELPYTHKDHESSTPRAARRPTGLLVGSGRSSETDERARAVRTRAPRRTRRRVRRRYPRIFRMRRLAGWCQRITTARRSSERVVETFDECPRRAGPRDRWSRHSSARVPRTSWPGRRTHPIRRVWRGQGVAVGLDETPIAASSRG